MRLLIPETANANCHVCRSGWQYPIMIWAKRDFDQAVHQLSKLPQFGEPAREFHFVGAIQGRLQVKNFYSQRSIEHSGWYAGQRRWREVQTPKRDFWIVFESDRLRTMALLLLND